MSNIYNCERIQNRIENHSHYGNCFNGPVYNDFSSKRGDLGKCRNCYNELSQEEKEIINVYYKNINLEKEINNIKQTTEIEYGNTLKNFSDKEMAMSLENKNKIDSIIKINAVNKIDIENQLKLLDEEISILKIKIDKQKELYEKEVDYQKKNKLNEIKNEYKLKLIKYQNEKEKEKERYLAKIAIEKEEFALKKEVEINDMKNKALFSQKLRAIFKNIL